MRWDIIQKHGLVNFIESDVRDCIPFPPGITGVEFYDKSQRSQFFPDHPSSQNLYAVKRQHGGQGTYNVTFRRVRATIVVLEKQ